MPIVKFPKRDKRLELDYYPENNPQLRSYLLGLAKDQDERLTYASMPPRKTEREKKHGVIRNTRFSDPGEEGYGLLFAAPIAYHGSPYKFEKFLADRIGTGEGAQAFGHGLYFAENPETAIDYHKRLSGYIADNKPMDSVKAWNWAINKYGVRTEDGKGVGGIVNKVMEQLNAGVKENPYIGKGHSEKVFEDIYANVKKGKGYLYKVDITPPAEKFLDWDKPLSEQRHILNDIWGKIETHIREEANNRAISSTSLQRQNDLYRMVKNPENATGEFLIHGLRRALGGDKEVSKFLYNNGIPGIRYLDQGSRQAGKGTYNYVVFNDKDVKILERK